MKSSEASYRIALAGNPNCGKTSIFNGLTGARQHVANYPGVTVEKRSGHYQHGDSKLHVIDLPGTYSLNSYSPEERIAQDELLYTPPDVTVVVVDSTNLQRSMVLLAQVMLVGANPVLCLNMWDEAGDSGQSLDVEQLHRLLGFPVVCTVGHRGEGLDDLKTAIQQAIETPYQRSRLVLGQRLEKAVAQVSQQLPDSMFTANQSRWVATRLLSGDPLLEEALRCRGDEGKVGLEAAASARRLLEGETGRDAALFITERFFGFVDGLLKETLTTRPREDARAVSDMVDSVLVHKFLGLPFFLLAMYGIFWLTFSVGEYPMGWIESGVELLSGWVSAAWPEGQLGFFRSLVIDAIIGGVGGVIIFLPNIVLLFAGLALLEDTGYMARAAFLVDRFMHRFGLHGKSFIPMITGFGCSIPGIMGTRILENEKDRLVTMLVLPLVPCGARLPIWMLLVPAFFPPAWRAPVLWFIYFFGIGLALLLALLLRRTFLKSEDAPFVMELPPYRAPAARGVVSKMNMRSWLYLRKAGTIILGVSILMWFLTAYPKPDITEIEQRLSSGQVELTDEQLETAIAAEQLQYSVAGRIGKFIEPVVRPMGFDWKLGTAMLGAFAAKEVFVSQLGIVYSLGETDEESVPLRQRLQRDYSPMTGVALILFLLIATPCMATVAITRRESGSWKWAALQFFGLTAIAYVLAALAYQIGTLIGF